MALKTKVNMANSELATIIDQLAVPAYRLMSKDWHQDRIDEAIAPALTAMAVRTPRLSLLLVRDAMDQVTGLGKSEKEALRVLIPKTWARFVTKNKYSKTGEKLPAYLRSFCNALQTAKKGCWG
eukprot:6186974-Amphidinium_carterae.1